MKAIDRAGSVFLRAVLRRMRELGLNQTTLAQRMNASRPYIVKVLHGDVSITLRTAARFAKALEMDFIPTLVPKATSGDCGPAPELAGLMANPLSTISCDGVRPHGTAENAAGKLV